MKKLKKLLAIIMVVTLLLSTLPMVNAGAKVKNPVLSLDTPTTVRVTEDGVECIFKPKTDGAYKFYSLSESSVYAVLYDSEWDIIAFSDFEQVGADFSLNANLKAGKTYYLEIATWDYLEDYVDIQVFVEETVGVDSMEITQYPFDTTVVKDYEYETYKVDGLEVAFTFTDGTVVDWAYDPSEDAEDELNGYLVDVYLDYDDEENYFLYIECGGLVETIPYTTTESQVESIEYFSKTQLEYYENSHGYWMDDNTYFYYYEVPNDAVIRVNYKDGTFVEASFYDEVDGIMFDDYSEQETTDLWSVGSDNYFYIYYLDAYVKVPVTILPCPFKSVTLNSAPTRDYVFGDMGTGYFDEDGKYILYPFDLTGLSFTVEYNDGTKETFDDDDFDNYGMYIDGYEYDVTEHTMSKPKTVETTLYYKGAQIKYNVDVIETYIKSIEVLKAPDRTVYEDRYEADFTGAVVKINYKDGTSAQATADENTLVYMNDNWLAPCIKVGNDVVTIYYDYSDETWEKYNVLSCAGVNLNYFDIEYVESRDVESITAENVSESCDGTIVTVNYEDGSSEVLTLDTLSYYTDPDGYTDAYVMTDNGIINISVVSHFDSNGDVEGYNIFAFDNWCYADAADDVLLGDVDGDGEISILDATEIQMVIAQLLPPLEDITVADVDGDGEVSIMDATAIQMQLAKIE